jgi:hypothetical protein
MEDALRYQGKESRRTNDDTGNWIYEHLTAFTIPHAATEKYRSWTNDIRRNSLHHRHQTSTIPSLFPLEPQKSSLSAAPEPATTALFVHSIATD